MCLAPQPACKFYLIEDKNVGPNDYKKLKLNINYAHYATRTFNSNFGAYMSRSKRCLLAQEDKLEDIVI